MTASVANGFGHILYTPTRRRARWRPTRSTPNTARPTRAATRGPRTRTTSPTPTRSGTSRTASRSTRSSTARTPACDDTRRLGPRRRQQLLRPGIRLVCWSRSTGVSRRQRLGRPVLPERLAGNRPERRARSGAAPEPDPVHQPEDERRHDELLNDRLRGRPAPDRGVGLAGQPTVL